MSSYRFWGVVSSAFFLCSIPAIFHQLKKIWWRKQLISAGELAEPATYSISVNQVFSSYCGVYSFFLFGLVLDAPDPFLTYPRLLVGLLLYLVLFEIFRDRNTRAVKYVFGLATLSLFVPIVLILSGLRSSPGVRSISHLLVCAATLTMAQGAYAQFVLLRRNQARGAVSLPMHTVLYLKDISGMFFGLQLGVSAWSIIFMHLSNIIMRAPILWMYWRVPR
jgi:hypothetical protein